jgi:tRNA threonylcarbamoyladenosine biosynthesis protein TsaB
LYRFEDGLATALVADAVSAPAEVPEALLEGGKDVVALGSGLPYFQELPAAVRERVCRQVTEQWPDSLDLLPHAEDRFQRGMLVDAASVHPVYLRNEIHWKKLSEQ